MVFKSHLLLFPAYSRSSCPLLPRNLRSLLLLFVANYYFRFPSSTKKVLELNLRASVTQVVTHFWHSLTFSEDKEDFIRSDPVRCWTELYGNLN